MKIKKLLSLVLSVLFLANSFTMVPQAASENRNILSSIKNDPKVRTAGYCAASAAGAGVLALCGYFIYKGVNSTHVTADDWFHRLGGTQADIDNYIRLANAYNSDALSSSDFTETFEQIKKDVNRYPNYLTPGISSQDLKNTFSRILNIYFSNHRHVSYTQGWDHVAYMIYYKFMLCRNTPLTIEAEAKVYFIYTKFMEMLVSKFGNNQKWDEQAMQYYQQSGVNIVSQDSNFVESVKCNIFMRGIFSGGACLFSTQKLIPKIIDIWDRIITDNNFVSPINHEFNADATINQLNKTIYLMLCEPGNTEIRENLSGGLNITCSGRTLTVSSK